MTNRDKVLLFDLGGVLVDVAPVDHAVASLGMSPDDPDVARWTTLDFWALFETNEIDEATFCERFISDCALTVDAAHVLTQFEAWNRGMLPGAVDLLAELRSKAHRLAVLSNTNAIHWQKLAGEMAIPSLVDVAFASHLLGLRKPDPRVYRHVAAELGVSMDALVFFDDNPDNIRGARELGIEAWQVEGVEALRERLTMLGYLKRT